MAHILVADDRPINRSMLVTLLGYFGHTFAEAGDGVEALAQVLDRLPDLIITDLLMPNMDGEELVRRLRTDPATKDVPVIIYTATYRVREASAIAARVGVRQVLTKPCEPKEIIAAVDEALDAAGAGALPRATATRAAPGPEITEIGQNLVAELDTVQDLNLRHAKLLKTAIQIAEQPAQSQTAMRTLEHALQDVQSLGPRLTGLVELGLDLAGAREPRELIEIFCRASQDILSARYAGVVALGAEGEPVRQFAARGLDDATRARVAGEIAECAAAKRVLMQDGAGRLVIGANPGDFTGLPASHPSVKNFLACPIAAHGNTTGWMYVADRLGESGFSTDDQRIAMALAAQFAIAWDSLALSKELERLVAERTRQLEASNRELEAFSYSVSHDLRGPLHRMDGFSLALLEDYGDKLDAVGKDFLQRIRAASQYMGSLIDDLLRLSQVARVELNVTRVDLSAIAQEITVGMGREQPGRALEWAIEAGLCVRADAGLMRIAMQNLLQNAWKFSRGKDRAVIRVGALQRDAKTVYFVADNGVGFDMAHAGSLFGAFQRLHQAEDFPGTGIGLAIVQRIIRRHGGDIWAEAKESEGATFFFSMSESDHSADAQVHPAG